MRPSPSRPSPADEDHAIYVDPASDWVDASGDHIYATLEVTLDDADLWGVDPEPTVIDPPNGDLPINDTCGPDNAVWLLPTGNDVSEGFTWRVAEDGLLTAEASEGYVFGDVNDDLDPMIREYGYAPDSGRSMPGHSGDPRRRRRRLTSSPRPAARHRYSAAQPRHCCSVAACSSF